MKKLLLSLLLLTNICFLLHAQSYSGPESVEYDAANNRWLISNSSGGKILAKAHNGVISNFAQNISPAPYGIEIVGDTVYACCNSYVKGYSLSTGAEVFSVNCGAQFLNGITHDNNGNLYATAFTGKKIYRINVASQTANVFVGNTVTTPNGIIYDGANNRLVFVNWGANAPIKAVSLSDSTVSTITPTTFGNCDGITRDGTGNWYVSVWTGQTVQKFDNNFTNPVAVVTGLSNPADIYYNMLDDTLAIPNAGNANNVVFFGFASTPVVNNAVCSDVPLQLLSDSVRLIASNGWVGTDSMIQLRVVNTSSLNFAYPLAKFEFLDVLPLGTSLHTSSQSFEVFASAFNAGDTMPIICYFYVAQPIADDYTVRVRVLVTNLSPSTIDTCWFADTLFVNLHPAAVISSVIALDKSTVSIYSNTIQTGGWQLTVTDNLIGTRVEVLDLSGRLMSETEIINGNVIIGTDFASGVYLLRINSHGNSITRKLIKL